MIEKEKCLPSLGPKGLAFELLLDLSVVGKGPFCSCVRDPFPCDIKGSSRHYYFFSSGRAMNQKSFRPRGIGLGMDEGGKKASESWGGKIRWMRKSSRHREIGK